MPPSPSTPRISKRPICGGIFIDAVRAGQSAGSSCRYRLRLRRLDRKKDGEGRTLAHFGMHLDPPAVLLHDLVGDRQPQSGALTDLLGGKERIENLSHDVFGDAVAV